MATSAFPAVTPSEQPDSSGLTHTDVEAWLVQSVATLCAAAPDAVQVPDLPTDCPSVHLEDPDDVEVLVALCQRQSPPAVYFRTTVFDERDLEDALERIGLQEHSRLESMVGQAAFAQVAVMAGGVLHTVTALNDELVLVRVQALAEAVDSGALADRRRPHDPLEAYRGTLTSLPETLREDLDFIRSGTNERARRTYALEVFLRVHPDAGPTPSSPVRGEISAAAERAWTWWRRSGRPARTQALREQLPELAPRVTGTRLDERKASAKALLTELDDLAVTTELIEELARATPTTPALL